ncbi:MAG: three-Cys-motif partner protein TcmP [Gammaproteobacteria bacterium]|nr:three-Cys-motif partner protein TcmP [Gammaproteobacteria bacterium]
MNQKFFDESKQQSQVKSAIVAKYFKVWANVMIGAQDRNPRDIDKRIAYIDLFAGPGRYSDGTISTPLRILQTAIENDELRQRLVTLFNDKDEKNTQSLSKAIEQLPGVDTLKHYPTVENQEVGARIVEMFEDMRLVPTLLFVDPWGYKGLSLRLINSVLKDWGCDCIFFFNYIRINMGLHNPRVQEHMEALFGKKRADKLREELSKLSSRERELAIVEELCQALKELGLNYVLPFCFKDDRGTRSSHHIIFVSKGFKGYEIMKNIMARESSDTEQGVATFEYNPASAQMKQGLLFQLSRPLDDLGDMLLEEFSGQELTMRQIYKQHNVNRPYTSKNYKEALKRLEAQKKIKTSRHKKGTFGDNVLVTFPDSGETNK